MPRPGEHETVQARILAYAEETAWTYVVRPPVGTRWRTGDGRIVEDTERPGDAE